jgi:hypothetical protein
VAQNLSTNVVAVPVTKTLGQALSMLLAEPHSISDMVWEALGGDPYQTSYTTSIAHP